MNALALSMQDRNVFFPINLIMRPCGVFTFEFYIKLLNYSMVSATKFLIKCLLIYSIEMKHKQLLDLLMYLCWFCISGNWDLKTKVPEQCKVAKVKLPSYFMEWINLKDVYLNFYKRRVMFTQLFFVFIYVLRKCRLPFACNYGI